MGEILAPLVRVALRYLAGVLLAKGVAVNPDELTDPDLVQVICYIAAALCAAISEGWWALARKYGWGN